MTATREIRKAPRLAALGAGFNDVFSKPRDLQQVQARLLQYR